MYVIWASSAYTYPRRWETLFHLTHALRVLKNGKTGFIPNVT